MKRRYRYVKPGEYKSAERRGISKKMIYDRLYRRGWTKKRALTEPVGRLGGAARIAEENGINRPTYYSRVRKGQDPIEAALTPLQKESRAARARKAKELTPEEWFQAKRAGTLKNKAMPAEWIERAKQHGVSARTLRDRLHRGWPLSEACTTSTKGKRYHELQLFYENRPDGIRRES